MLEANTITAEYLNIQQINLRKIRSCVVYMQLSLWPCHYRMILQFSHELIILLGSFYHLSQVSQDFAPLCITSEMHSVAKGATQIMWNLRVKM